jgi:hypothetical protein
VRGALAAAPSKAAQVEDGLIPNELADDGHVDAKLAAPLHGAFEGRCTERELGPELVLIAHRDVLVLPCRG